MIQIDLSQYSETARRDLCMALYRMTERHNPRGDEELPRKNSATTSRKAVGTNQAVTAGRLTDRKERA